MPFPLLAKDLTERAARLRTYVLRGMCGLFLVGWFWWKFQIEPGRDFDGGEFAPSLLGAGQSIFENLSVALCWALLILQPAIIAPVLTHEKERGTLSLLLLTPQRPTKLLLEKYLSGLIPMATLLLFALPIGAVAYSYGGVTQFALLSAALVLFGTWLQAGAAALLCSAWFRTTPSALIASYMLLGILYVGLGYTSKSEIMEAHQKGLRATSLGGWTSRNEGFGLTEYWESDFTNFPVSMAKQASQMKGWSTPSQDGQILLRSVADYREAFQEHVGFSIAALTEPLARFACWLLIPAAAFFVIARLVVTRRADPPPSRILPRFFRWLDSLFNRINRKFGGFAFASNRDALLANDPILWRESTTGVLGRPQNIIRLGYVISMLTVFIVLPAAPASDGMVRNAPKVIAALGALFVVVRAVESIAGERSRQSMETLLSTPIRRGDIVRQKARPVFWLSLAFLIPSALAYGASFYFLNVYGSGTNSSHRYSPDAELFRDPEWMVNIPVAVGTLFLIFWELRWLAMFIALKVGARTKATVIALGLVLAWTLLPLAAQKLMMESFAPGGGTRWYTHAVRVLQPGGMLGYVESGFISETGIPWSNPDASPFTAMVPAAFVLLAHLGIGATFRTLCIRRAGRYLHRHSS